MFFQMVREPCVAGQFYESSFDGLNKQIEECFHDKRGPGDVPVEKRTDKKISAILVPHAGYMFSGACAAWAYTEIAEAKFPDAFLLLGPNHFGSGSGISIGDWRTPLGLVKTHKDLIRGIKENTDLEITEHNHITEHSLEVQLPFLQFANKDMMPNLRIVPVTIGKDHDYQKIAKQLHDYLAKTKKDITIIVSTDFTHYGPSYRYVPFTSDIPKRLSKLDKDAIEFITKYDAAGFKEYVNKTGITICGFMPILVFLEMMRLREKQPRPHLLMHYTSGDVLNDYKNSVSYVSMVFK